MHCVRAQPWGQRGCGPAPTITGVCGVGGGLQTSLKVREGAEPCSKSGCDQKMVTNGKSLGFVKYLLSPA